MLRMASEQWKAASLLSSASVVGVQSRGQSTVVLVEPGMYS
jgi:hypothetical protein